MHAFTAIELRGAFLRAADYIERNPQDYNFSRARTPSYDRSACMWGHVGRELGFPDSTYIGYVALACGAKSDFDLYHHSSSLHQWYTHKANDAAYVMRAYANDRWPQEAANEDHTRVALHGQAHHSGLARYAGAVGRMVKRWFGAERVSALNA